MASFWVRLFFATDFRRQLKPAVDATLCRCASETRSGCRFQVAVGAQLDTPTMRANGLKAAEDSRSPKPRGMRRRFRQRDSVLDCGCPLPLLLAAGRCVRGYEVLKNESDEPLHKRFRSTRSRAVRECHQENAPSTSRDTMR